MTRPKAERTPPTDPISAVEEVVAAVEAARLAQTQAERRAALERSYAIGVDNARKRAKRAARPPRFRRQGWRR